MTRPDDLTARLRELVDELRQGSEESWQFVILDKIDALLAASAPAQFCRQCGASIPHRAGEGTCESCDPESRAAHAASPPRAASPDLHEWLQHKVDCRISDWEHGPGVMHSKRPDCTCGLATTLARAKKETS